ncbi:hypothetical protein [Azospirillum sp. ST 5-10]|uniref:hypothetical protein n=1 Tax=unclassified Azospirillum TaxID=2630922 RepID=UPI003F4A46BC
MKRYQVAGAVARFAPGFVLALSPEQAAARATCLHRVDEDGDLYEVTGRVEFKRGEVLGVAHGEIGKDVLAELREPRARGKAGGAG